MKRSTANFWVDALALASLIATVSTGALLRGFPAGAPGRTVLGVGRADWGDLHWVVSVAFLVLVAAHLVLHWGWVKTNAEKRLRLGPTALAIALAAAFLGLCIAAPAYLTRNMPRRKTARGAPAAAGASRDATNGRGAP